MFMRYNVQASKQAKHNCALFAPCEALETAYYIRDG